MDKSAVIYIDSVRDNNVYIDIFIKQHYPQQLYEDRDDMQTHRE